MYRRLCWSQRVWTFRRREVCFPYENRDFTLLQNAHTGLGSHRVLMNHPSSQLLLYGPDNTQVLNIPCDKCIEILRKERRRKHKCADRGCAAGCRRLCMLQQYHKVFDVTAETFCILTDRYQTFPRNLLTFLSIPLKMHETCPSEILLHVSGVKYQRLQPCSTTSLPSRSWLQNAKRRLNTNECFNKVT